jgi:DNA replication protein DnaC
MDVETIKTQFKNLNLKTAANELDEVLTKNKKAVSLKWAIELLEREIDARSEKAIQSRIKRADFPEITALESFDWKFNPKINRAKIEELATLNFVEQNRIALFLGAPGVGKTHISIALGVKAVKAGYRVYSTSAKRLCQQIKLAKLKNNLDVLFKKFLSAKLWIIDDWGVVSMERDIAEEIFDLFDRRKYSSSMILTSNRDVKEWGEVFPDPVIANATIDRIFDRSEIILFFGNSYRLKGRIKLSDIDISKIKV